MSGKGGLTQETYVERLFGRDIVTFRYECIGLPDLAADDYRERDNPLAPGLSALMKPSRLGRTLQKAFSIRQTLGAPLDEAHKALIVNVIETYLKLSETEEEEFRRIVGQGELQEVKEMLTVYEERGIVKGKRSMLLKQLRLRFGELPENVVARIQAMETEAELDALSERFVTATSLEDMGLREN
jgi:hypothetical protein